MIKSVQFYNPLHHSIPLPIKASYQEYLQSLLQDLKFQTTALNRLARLNNQEPAWISDRQAIVWISIDSCEQDYLELVPFSKISSPQEMLDYLKQDLNINTQLKTSKFARATIERLWAQLVENIVWIKTNQTPVLVWHLERDYLTITTISLELIEQNAATRTN